MLIQTFILNFLFLLISCRRYRGGGGGRAGAGVGKVTQTFGKGVATLIKDIKQGNWGGQQIGQQYDQRKGNRFTDQSKYYQSIGNDTQFYVLLVCGVILVVTAILYFIIKILPHMNQKDTIQQMKKRHAQRFKHHEALKCVAENGIHLDKAFGRLQKIKYR